MDWKLAARDRKTVTVDPLPGASHGPSEATLVGWGRRYAHVDYGSSTANVAKSRVHPLEVDNAG